jgi:hypothetical protein
MSEALLVERKRDGAMTMYNNQHYHQFFSSMQTGQGLQEKSLFDLGE